MYEPIEEGCPDAFQEIIVRVNNHINKHLSKREGYILSNLKMLVRI